MRYHPFKQTELRSKPHLLLLHRIKPPAKGFHQKWRAPLVLPPILTDPVPGIGLAAPCRSFDYVTSRPKGTFPPRIWQLPALVCLHSTARPSRRISPIHKRGACMFCALPPAGSRVSHSSVLERVTGVLWNPAPPPHPRVYPAHLGLHRPLRDVPGL